MAKGQTLVTAPIEEIRRQLLSGMLGRERLLEAAGFDFVEDTRDAVERIRKHRKSKQTSTSLRACELTLDLADVRRRREQDGDSANRPVNVEIILGDKHEAPAITADSVVELPPESA